MERTFAIVEREMRRFRRSKTLIIMSLLMPIVQLIVLGYAFGGTVKNLKLGVVDQDRGVPAVKMRELAGAVSANAKTFVPVQYPDLGEAVTALRNGKLNGVLAIPPDFSRRVLARDDPHVAIIEDNTDGFVAGTMAASASSMVGEYDEPPPTASRISPSTTLDVVEVYPYVPYIQYLLPGSVVMSIFMMVMIGGGIIFLDDKSRGLHEGYLVTPITKLELVLGFTISGVIKSVLSACVVITLGSVIAGVPNAFEPVRLMRLFVVVAVTSSALTSMMFLLMVRMNNPLVMRALFGILNTMLYFPSGAVYPQQAFPGWMRVLAVADPFTYAVHALKCLVLKDTGFVAIAPDLLYLTLFTLVSITAASVLFRRTL
jgi:ABC-2 type transport system permease protein